MQTQKGELYLNYAASMGRKIAFLSALGCEDDGFNLVIIQLKALFGIHGEALEYEIWILL